MLTKVDSSSGHSFLIPEVLGHTAAAPGSVTGGLVVLCRLFPFSKKRQACCITDSSAFATYKNVLLGTQKEKGRSKLARTWSPFEQRSVECGNKTHSDSLRGKKVPIAATNSTTAGRVLSLRLTQAVVGSQ